MWLACEVHTPSGVERFGPDGEPCWGVSFQTQNAGGFGTGQVTVPRPEWATRDDLLFCHVRIYGPGNRTVYEGRVADVGAVDQHATQLVCEGWAAHLDDNQFFRALYVDRDLSHWEPMADQLRVVLVAFTFSVHDATVALDPDTVEQVIVCGFQGNASSNAQWVALHYRSPVPLGSIYYEFARGTNVTSSYDAKVQSDTADDELFGSSTATSNLCSAASSTGTLNCAEGERIARVYLQTPGSDGGTPSVDHEVRFGGLAVFGDNGLTKRGVAPEEGYYPGDIIRHAVEAGAPMLVVRDGAVELGPPVVYQAAHLDPTTVRAVIQDAGAYGTPASEVPEWGVYEDREFFWRSPGGGRRWRVRRDQVALPTDDGPTAQDRYAEIVVRWQDAVGIEHTVGPGGSGAEFEDSRLRVEDYRNNPASKVNGRRLVWDAGTTYQEGAVLLGQAELADRNSNLRRGSVTLTGTVRDLSGAEEPAWAVRACDTVVVEDEPGVLEPQEQIINGTSYDHESGVMNGTLGVEPLQTELILARLRNAVGV